MGTLFALPPDFDTGTITEPDVRKVAEALRNYGAYVVDTQGSDTGFISNQAGTDDEFPDFGSDQMIGVLQALNIVTNSAEDTLGGGRIGAARMAECAPAFADGSGGAPAHCGA